MTLAERIAEKAPKQIRRISKLTEADMVAGVHQDIFETLIPYLERQIEELQTMEWIAIEDLVYEAVELI